MRKAELNNQEVKSIYFGGGTPSLLEEQEVNSLMEVINQQYHLADQLEITLEANPDDLTREKFLMFKKTGINRLSIGIQSFDSSKLKFINRAHTGRQARESLLLAQEIGFTNFSADLIYAIPPSDLLAWENDLDQLLSFSPPHISLYGLTIEEKTVFGNWARKGKLVEVDEEIAAQQYQMAVSVLKNQGYDHYEVSNFAKAGMHSRHNSAYWEDKKYLGVGPGAHSYDGEVRSYNISNNPKYIKSILAEDLPRTIESLSPTEKINDYLFTHLRTSRGINLDDFEFKFDKSLTADYSAEIDEFLRQQMVTISNRQLKLTSHGFMLADEITYRLFYVD